MILIDDIIYKNWYKFRYNYNNSIKSILIDMSTMKSHTKKPRIIIPDLSNHVIYLVKKVRQKD